MADTPDPIIDPNAYTRQFIPPLCRPAPMPVEEWTDWSAKMERAREIRDAADE